MVKISRLKRRHNNLRKAQKRLEKVSKRHKQFQVHFERQPDEQGQYRTNVRLVRGEKTYHGNNRGLLHKIVNAKYRITGDVPSVTKAINITQPTTFRGKTLKKLHRLPIPLSMEQ